MPTIMIKCTEIDQDVREYEIIYNGVQILVNFNYFRQKDTIYFNKLNIESEGPNTFGPGFLRVIREIAKEFCVEFEVTKIEISGTKRTSGKGKGKLPNTLRFDFGKSLK